MKEKAEDCSSNSEKLETIFHSVENIKSRQRVVEEKKQMFTTKQTQLKVEV